MKTVLHTVARVLLPLTVLLAVHPVTAQDHPNFERGLTAATAYDNGDVDSVNLFNGNLHLAIPLGFGYPLSSSLGYGFALHYNSNVWELEDGPLSGGQPTVAANPEPLSNAGLGWTLTFGRLFAPNTPPYNDSNNWLLLEPDGSRRAFYDRLHSADPTSTTHGYTRDGSYLRLKTLVSGERQVESPNGTIRIFRTDGRLRRITDPFGNYVDFTYAADNSKWEMTDQHGRLQTIHLRTTADAANGHVASLILDGFGTTTATYTLTYAVTSIERSYRDTAANSTTVSVPLLTRVDLPDGSAWSLAYNTTNVYTNNEWQPSGSLKSVTLPTLGRYDYRYADYGFPEDPGACDGDPICFPEWVSKGDGVASKQVFDAAGVSRGTWTYQQIHNALDTDKTETRVKSPAGDENRHFFRLSPYIWQHGLPYHPTAKDASNTRYLSQEIYQGTVSTGTKKRSVYLRFETDLPLGMKSNQRVASRRIVYHDDSNRYADVTYSKFDGLGNYRQMDTGGNFNSSNARTAFTNFNPTRGTYDWDWITNSYGASHSFTLPATGDRWRLDTFTDTSVKEGTQEIKTQVCLEKTVAPDPVGPTGFVTRLRRLRSSSPGSTDLLAVLQKDGNGNVSRQQLYGGDLQTLGTQADPCSATLPSGDVYRLDSTWQKGVLTVAEVKNASGGSMGLKLVDLDVDGTGLVTTRRDVAGIQTYFEYDTLGRVLWEKPTTGHGAWTEKVYTRATSSSALAQVSVRMRNGSKTATILGESKLRFDAFGRLWQEQQLMPNGTWSTRERLYDGNGRLASLSEWGATSRKTTFTGYDPFGRPSTITPPDGSAHRVTFGYLGERQVDRQTRVATATGSESIAFTTEEYDRQGRLYKFIEASGLSGAYVTTTYGYDAAGRLKSVSTPATVSTPSGNQNVTQTRIFTWDNRGFLTSIRSPEKGTSGNGTVYRYNINALGLPTRTVDGPSDLTFTWDRAGRLTEVRNRHTNEVLESYAFATGNLTNNWRRGKLETADRYNYLQVGTTPFLVQMRESYTYGGVGGRVSNRVTSWANATTGDSFTQAWTYDPLGNVATITYPRCTHSYCNGAATSSRTASFTYSRGRLTGATSTTSPSMGTSSLTYHSNGTVASVTHGNGVSWTQGLDPYNIPRPASYQAAYGGVTLWNTGSYAFDGTGNVKAIGGSAFVYDPVSRLTSTSLETSALGGTTPKTQSFTYDAFGNLTNIAGTVGRSIPVTNSTNRMATVGSGPTCDIGETYYDSGGNLLCWQGNAFTYDPLGRVTRTYLSGVEYDHVYTAGGERVMTYQPGVGYRWTLRDLDGKVLREFANVSGNWTVERDYLYRNGVLLAAKQPSGEVYHIHPDHLGSPRLVTGNSGVKRAFHAYYPYGEEATGINQDGERMKFTGHERDLGVTTSASDDVDYQFERYYLARLGRYASFDPVGGNPWVPQSWNRYQYVLGNPLNLVDPYGLTGAPPDTTFLDHIDVCADAETGGACSSPPPSTPRSRGPSWWLLTGGGGGGAGGGGGGRGSSDSARPPSLNEALQGRSGPCDWGCQVMRGVSTRALTGTRYLEAGVVAISTTWLFSGGGAFAMLEGGSAPALFTLLDEKATIDVVYRVAQGADGAISRHLIERVEGTVVSRTHQVWREGRLIHQHQAHIGRYGARHFPDEWVQYGYIQ